MSASTTLDVTPTENLQVSTDENLDFIATKRLAQTVALVVLTDYTEIRYVPRIILSISTSAGHRHQTALVDCAASLNFV
jgi:hypothetical protein